jgi:hypothetical protein
MSTARRNSRRVDLPTIPDNDEIVKPTVLTQANASYCTAVSESSYASDGHVTDTIKRAPGDVARRLANGTNGCAAVKRRESFNGGGSLNGSEKVRMFFISFTPFLFIAGLL